MGLKEDTPPMQRPGGRLLRQLSLPSTFLPSIVASAGHLQGFH